jgi:hypothetical protein
VPRLHLPLSRDRFCSPDHSPLQSYSRLKLRTSKYVRFTKVIYALEAEAGSIIQWSLVVEVEVRQLGSTSREERVASKVGVGGLGADVMVLGELDRVYDPLHLDAPPIPCCLSALFLLWPSLTRYETCLLSPRAVVCSLPQIETASSTSPKSSSESPVCSHSIKIRLIDLSYLLVALTNLCILSVVGSLTGSTSARSEPSTGD